MYRAVVCVATVVLLIGSPVPAQETTGAVLGTVRSQDELALPGVTVQLVDPDRGLERVALSGRDGSYRFVALPPARYELTASLQAFQTEKRPIKVDLGRTVTSDIEMQVGAVTDVIEVTGARPQVDPTSTVTGWSLDLMLGYGRTTAGIDWDVRLDVFNVFNTHGVLYVSDWAEDAGDGEPYDDFGEPLYFQTPRSVRLGLRLSF
jgi:hypothetical protein